MQIYLTGIDVHTYLPKTSMMRVVWVQP